MLGFSWIFSYTAFQAKAGGTFSLEIFLEKIFNNITNPMGTFSSIFSEGAGKDFFSFLMGFSIFYLVLFFIGLSKAVPKNEYSDIEHGSSDWSQGGEQYKILSKNSCKICKILIY